jgi:CRISPR/Cas system-associated exonuclease Cas4 (RecB family)
MSIPEIKDNKRLTGDQRERLKSIWATDGCPRSQYFRILEYERLPDHYVTWRGSILHQLVERHFCGKELNFWAFPEARDKVMNDLTHHMGNFRIWLDETEIDLSEVECEVKYQLDLDEGFYMRRKVDLLTPSVIIDFKSGRYSGKVGKGDRMAMVYSIDAVARAGEGYRDAVIVYLGGARPYEVWPFKNPKTNIERSRQEAKELVDRNIQVRKMIEAGREVPVDKYGNFCKFCQYRYACRGI